MSNIPASEGPINNPEFGQQTSFNEPKTEVVTPKPRVTPPVVRKTMNMSPKAKPANGAAGGTYDPANDSRNAEYIAARNKLNSNSSTADVAKVEQMGMATWESIHGKK